MRRAAALAIVLVMALASAVQAAGPAGTVAGHVTYYTGPDNIRMVTVTARDSDPVAGRWSWTNRSMRLSGPLTCLVVDGPDAWMAGPTSDGEGAAFLWVHDGGSPGSLGDTAFAWLTDPGQTLGDMEQLCLTKETAPYGFDPFPVEAGNVIVRS